MIAARAAWEGSREPVRTWGDKFRRIPFLQVFCRHYAEHTFILDGIRRAESPAIVIRAPTAECMLC
jgi:hypothetical protein